MTNLKEELEKVLGNKPILSTGRSFLA